MADPLLDLAHAEPDEVLTDIGSHGIPLLVGNRLDRCHRLLTIPALV